MADKENILKKLTKIDDKLLVSKMLDKAERAEYRAVVTHSDFLDPYQKSVIERVFSEIKSFNYEFDGGYTGAERVVVVFRPGFVYSDKDTHNDDILKVIRVELSNRDTLSHRDYLGALMSLGIKREKIGDILVREEACDIIAMNEISEFIMYNLNRIGNSKINIQVSGTECLEAPEPKVKDIHASVAALRLDCIASAGYGISRSKMADFIKAGKVNLNWEVATSPTKLIKSGDNISIRGKGRIILESIDGMTKKDRVKVLIRKYV